MSRRQTFAAATAGILLTGAVGVAFAQGGPALPRRLQADGVEQLAAKLNARERAIERREATLKDREADLASAETRLSERLDELEALCGRIDEQLQGLAEDDERRREALVTMVEKMKAKEAASMVGALDKDLAVDVIDRMTPSKAAKVLAAMPPQLAAALAADLAAPVELP